MTGVPANCGIGATKNNRAAEKTQHESNNDFQNCCHVEQIRNISHSLSPSKRFLDFARNDKKVTRDTEQDRAQKRRQIGSRTRSRLISSSTRTIRSIGFPGANEAFEKARRENKPIFLSIGYSTCHWCHVMAHESFEDDATAEIMNREFVNIKVDREERPDVDRVYMTFVQATTGGGGWPMSVWLTPELEPFVGGTYFPPEDRYGQPGFRGCCSGSRRRGKTIARKFRSRERTLLRRCAKRRGTRPSAGKIDAAILEAAYQQFARTFDAHEGGFRSRAKISAAGDAQSFYAIPRAQSGNRCRAARLGDGLAYLAQNGGGRNARSIGGGFHRYSVDGFWHVPHFEKMLYDQAQLAIAYLDAFQITGDADFEAIARDILDYVRRDMTSQEGGFYSAEDADSPIVAGDTVNSGSWQQRRKARFTSGRNRRSTTRLATRRRAFHFTMALKRTAMLQPEPIRMASCAARIF